MIRYIYTLYQRCKELYMICVRFGPHKSSFLSVSGTLNFYVIFKLVLDVFLSFSLIYQRLLAKGDAFFKIQTKTVITRHFSYQWEVLYLFVQNSNTT